MKTRLTLVALFALFFFLITTETFAQEQNQSQAVTVNGSQVNNNVLILSVRKGKESFELHCNVGMSDCTVLQPGDYSMVQLPKNWGMYDCSDVDLYRATPNSSNGDKLGEYCIIEKRVGAK